MAVKRTMPSGKKYLNEELLVVFWDVKHGNAAYIKTPNDKSVVIDLGRGSYLKNNEKFSPLNHLSKKFKVTDLEYVIVTHPHLDHIEDIQNLKLFNVKKFTTPLSIDKNKLMSGIWNAINLYLMNISSGDY